MKTSGFVDLRRYFPGLRGHAVHVVPAGDRERLAGALAEAGFEPYVLDGAAIRDEPGFMRESARALAFPDYFGANWDAVRDCLLDLLERPSRRVAVVWASADVCLAADVQTFVAAVVAFRLSAVELMTDAGDGEPLQLELFVIGDGPGFGAR